MKESVFPKPLTVMFVSSVGAAVGAGIILYKSRSTIESQQFVDAPQFCVWLFLISLLTAFLAIAAAILWQSLRQLKEHFVGNRIEIALSSLIIGLLFVLPYFAVRLPDRFYVLVYHRLKMLLVTCLAFLVGFMAMVGILLVHAALRTTFKDIQPDEKHIVNFLRLREHLQRFLSILGSLVGLITLATGALRNVSISIEAATKTDFPPELVLAFGAYFTVILALAYIPTYTLLIAVGRQLCETFFPIPSLESESLAKWYSERKSLEDLLQIRVSVGQNFQTSMAIFAPLVSGILSVLMGG